MLLDRFEYMRLNMDIIPDRIKNQYNLDALTVDSWVYIEIRKGMYGLPQSGILANKLLIKRLDRFGYYPVEHTPGLWKHKSCPVICSLVVDDFGIKYVGKENAVHLVNSLEADYKITIDWTGGTFCGIDLKWDYEKRTVGISMPGYVKKALLKFNHLVPTTPQDQPYKHTLIGYGAKQQFATEDT